MLPRSSSHRCVVRRCFEALCVTAPSRDRPRTQMSQCSPSASKELRAKRVTSSQYTEQGLRGHGAIVSMVREGGYDTLEVLEVLPATACLAVQATRTPTWFASVRTGDDAGDFH
eukprot:TRINITY_DN95821_c0_g1_i1.p2 TRINITY_DN95821_c0_g1~~TRINITY_DN95821_c0_g1_i1.p2  ORF type:complete len:114 (-),score=9.01 TRINITY_DN95821_c0_g1_i1:318-659(-)